jgi:hypothetical protein
MDPIPNSAIAMAIGLLMVIWAFLVHMIMSQGPDAHLQFLTELMEDAEDRSGSPLPRGLSPCLPLVNGIKTLHEAVEGVGDEVEPRCMQHVRLEVPLLFATSIRGRGL